MGHGSIGFNVKNYEEEHIRKDLEFERWTRDLKEAEKEAEWECEQRKDN